MTMIDRMAQAMYASERLVNRSTGQPLEWEDLPPAVQRRWRKRSRAAIEAMREPTEQMLATSGAHAAVGGVGRPSDGDKARDVWREMIDAIRREADAALR